MGEQLRDGDWLMLIEPGKEYYWKRTPGWQWNGIERWWEVFVVFYDGFNGGGGACIRELWRWNGSAQTMRDEQRSLSYEDSVFLVKQLLTSQELADHA